MPRVPEHPRASIRTGTGQSGRRTGEVGDRGIASPNHPDGHRSMPAGLRRGVPRADADGASFRWERPRNSGWKCAPGHGLRPITGRGRVILVPWVGGAGPCSWWAFRFRGFVRR